MDRPEELAREYLRNLGYSPKHEPLGYKTFPDFEIENSIGVEVRRLNENYFEDFAPSGLEQKSQPLIDGINDIFSQYKKSHHNQNFRVTIKLKRPILKLKSIKKSLKPILEEWVSQSHIEPEKIHIPENISFRLTPKTTIEDQIFHVGSIIDFDSGGYVLPNLLTNLNYCILQKTQKANNSRHRFKELWLILIDEISYGLDESDKNYIIENVEKPKTWSRIITLNTLNGNEILKI